MRTLLPTCLSVLCVATARAQDGSSGDVKEPATSRPAAGQDAPASRPAPEALPGKQPDRKRNGNFFGLRFVERVREVDGGSERVLYLCGVDEGSDAARLGFRKGDVLLGIDGWRPKNADEFLMGFYMRTASLDRRSGGFRPTGRDHAFDVERDGKRIKVAATVLALDEHPKVGEQAPDFVLKDRAGKQEVRASGLWKDKPLFLVFGSYT
ncbi:MAG: hypothetical protein R3F30_15015 [Planctomycetota bacterium]